MELSTLSDGPAAAIVFGGTALATVLQWRYVPGKRGGVAEAMWFNVPINFVLE